MLAVGENAGQIAGFAAASALCAVFPVEAELEILAVAPTLQGCGVGRALLQATFDWAATQNAAILRLEVRASNERALRIYGKGRLPPDRHAPRLLCRSGRRCGCNGTNTCDRSRAACQRNFWHNRLRSRYHGPGMVRDGYFYALGLLLVAVVLWKIAGSAALAALPVALALFFLWFFRDPPRRVPAGEGVLVSPADGKVTEAEWIETPAGSRLRLSIFLNVFDVHVNRSPVAGTVTQVNYKKGLFLNAMRADSNVLNESNTVVIEGEGYTVQVKQVAGLLARRIVCFVKPGDTVQRGQRFGMIKFWFARRCAAACGQRSACAHRRSRQRGQHRACPCASES